MGPKALPPLVGTSLDELKTVMGSHRGEQYAVAEKSGGDDKPGDVVAWCFPTGSRDPAKQWRVIGRSWTSASGYFDQLELTDRRQQHLGVTQ